MSKEENGIKEQSELTAGSLRGHLLISMPGLQDPNFAHTVTYICDHSADGAMGIVLNHPLHISISEIFQQLDLTDLSGIGDEAVLAGGPVQTERGFVLHPTGRQWASTMTVTDDVSLSASRDILVDIANNRGPETPVIALGYAGWGGGQLEDEIAENSWLTTPCEPRILFNTPCEQRWSAAAKHLGFDLDLISGTAGHS